MTSAARKIRWIRPSAGRSTLDLSAVVPVMKSFSLEPLSRPAARRHQLDTLARVGVPLSETATNAREYALDLLMLAAEVEHALMVQYLYTASSIIETDNAEENYRRKILNVAIQEMGHFATVQNLLLLLGGPDALHVQRDVQRARSEKNPIPFVLDPVSLPTLAKYVAAEMPVDPPPEQASQVKRLVDIAKQDAGIEPHRVGAIYTLLEWLFMDELDARRLLNLRALVPELDQYGHLTDADLKPSDQFEPFQAEKEEWSGADWPTLLILVVRSRKEAVQAITDIAQQGEGFQGAPDSHFREFMELVDAFEKDKIKIKPIATSPDLGNRHGGERPTPITSPFTKLWGKIFSLQYTLILLSIRHAIATPRGTVDHPGMRQKIIGLAMRGMRMIVGSVSEILVSLPLRDGDAQLAGPPFDLNPEDLNPDVKMLPARHLELLDRLAPLYAEVEQAPEFPNNSNYRTALGNLRNVDKQRRRLFEESPLA